MPPALRTPLPRNTYATAPSCYRYACHSAHAPLLPPLPPAYTSPHLPHRCLPTTTCLWTITYAWFHLYSPATTLVYLPSTIPSLRTLPATLCAYCVLLAITRDPYGLLPCAVDTTTACVTGLNMAHAACGSRAAMAAFAPVDLPLLPLLACCLPHLLATLPFTACSMPGLPPLPSLLYHLCYTRLAAYTMPRPPLLLRLLPFRAAWLVVRRFFCAGAY